jgi:hypothetical protein
MGSKPLGREEYAHVSQHDVQLFINGVPLFSPPPLSQCSHLKNRVRLLLNRNMNIVLENTIRRALATARAEGVRPQNGFEYCRSSGHAEMPRDESELCDHCGREDAEISRHMRSS